MEFKYAPYSFSRISTFLPCPRKFYYSYIIKATPEPGDPTALHKGSCVHHLLESYFNKDVNFDIETTNYKPEIKEAAKAIFEKATTSNDLMKKFADECEVVGTEVLIYLDENFKPVDKEKDALIKGYIDLLLKHKNSDTYIVVDHKTGKMKKDKPLTPIHDDVLQVSAYALWVKEKYNPTKLVGFYNYVEHNHFVRRIYDDNLLELTKITLKNKIEKIENETEFDTVITPLCPYCPFQKQCSEERNNKWLRK